MQYKRRRILKRGKRSGKRNLTRVVKTIVNKSLEKKFKNVALFGEENFSAPYVAGLTWAWNSSLGTIKQGTNASERIGNKIKVLGMWLTIIAKPHVVNMPAGGGSICKIIVVHDKDSRGSLPTASNIFNSDNIYSLRNRLFMNRYSIVKEFTHTMVGLTTDGIGIHTASGFSTYKVWIKINKVLDFQSNVGDVGDLWADNWYVGICASVADCCQVNVVSQIVFQDM